MSTIRRNKKFVVLTSESAIGLARKVNNYFKKYDLDPFTQSSVSFHGPMIYVPRNGYIVDEFIQSLILHTPIHGFYSPKEKP